jgi:hypothetical protein
MMKIEGSGSASGSISQRHGSADPDPNQNVMDPQHWTVMDPDPHKAASFWEAGSVSEFYQFFSSSL